QSTETHPNPRPGNARTARRTLRLPDRRTERSAQPRASAESVSTGTQRKGQAPMSGAVARVAREQREREVARERAPRAGAARVAGWQINEDLRRLTAREEPSNEEPQRDDQGRFAASHDGGSAGREHVPALSPVEQRNAVINHMLRA